MCSRSSGSGIAHDDCKETGELGSCKIVKLLQLELSQKKPSQPKRDYMTDAIHHIGRLIFLQNKAEVTFHIINRNLNFVTYLGLALNLLWSQR